MRAKLTIDPCDLFEKGTYSLTKAILLRILFKHVIYNNPADNRTLEVFGEKEIKHRRRAYKVILYRLKGCSLSESAKKVGVSQERVRQIEARMYRRLRQTFHLKDKAMQKEINLQKKIEILEEALRFYAKAEILFMVEKKDDWIARDPLKGIIGSGIKRGPTNYKDDGNTARRALKQASELKY